MRSVVILTNMPSPYQAHLFDLLAADGRVAPRVIYEQMSDVGRQWSEPALAHEHACCGEAPFERLARSVRDCDLCVFGCYRHPVVRRLLAERAATGRSFVFWGERFGVDMPILFGAAYRRWALRALHRTNAEMWGMGGMAVASFRREFGPRRRYRNLPYSSNLAAFLAIERDEGEARVPRLLFSGSLIPRKGADLVAEALGKILAAGVALDAIFVGDGLLRPRLEALRRRHPERVELLGFRQMSALPAIYARADALVAPSRHDGWGLVVVEAMASGLPVLASDRTGAAVELVTPETGWLTRAGDAAALERALLALARTPVSRLRAMGATARGLTHAHTGEAGRDRFVQAVEDCLAGAG